MIAPRLALLSALCFGGRKALKGTWVQSLIHSFDKAHKCSWDKLIQNETSAQKHNYWKEKESDNSIRFFNTSAAVSRSQLLIWLVTGAACFISGISWPIYEWNPRHLPGLHPFRCEIIDNYRRKAACCSPSKGMMHGPCYLYMCVKRHIDQLCDIGVCIWRCNSTNNNPVYIWKTKLCVNNMSPMGKRSKPVFILEIGQIHFCMSLINPMSSLKDKECVESWNAIKNNKLNVMI